MKQLWSPWRMKYIQSNKPKDCFLCQALLSSDGMDNLVIARGKHVFIILNQYPYTSGHLMVVPNQHIATLPELDAATRAELMECTSLATQVVADVYRPGGFNLGINIGEASGAGVADHIHLHVVPRWSGDTNFMLAVADTRVLPEALGETYRRISEAWNSLSSNPTQ